MQIEQHYSSVRNDAVADSSTASSVAAASAASTTVLPMDIEFAVDGSGLVWIVQARPETVTYMHHDSIQKYM